MAGTGFPGKEERSFERHMEGTLNLILNRLDMVWL